MRYLLSCLVITMGLLPQFVSADSPSPSVSKIPAPPLPIQSTCSDMQKPFGALADVMGKAARAATDAGTDAKALGARSSSQRFRTVEDDYTAVGKLLGPGLDATSSVPVWLDSVPDGSQKVAASNLAVSYDKSLRMLQQYAAAAVVYERAAYDRRMRLEPGVGVGSDGSVIVSLGTLGPAMNADDARAVLYAKDDLVADASRTLKLPEYQWQKACGFSPDATGAAPKPQ